MKRLILQIVSWFSFFALAWGMLFNWVPADRTAWTALALFFIVAICASFQPAKNTSQGG